MYAARFIPTVFAAASVFLASPCARAAPLQQEAAGYRQQGLEAQQRGDREAARAWYQKAVTLDPTYAAPHNDLGILDEEAGRLEDAERSYVQALALDPNCVDAHANLAMLYERTGEREKATYHWMKRYQLGDPADEWRVRAESRLIALGMLNAPSLKGQQQGRQQGRQKVLDDVFRAHAQSLEEFRNLTDAHGDWR